MDMAKLTILIFCIPEVQTHELALCWERAWKTGKKQLEQVLSCILGAPGQQLTFFLRAKFCLV
jgi:hypothetical protein